MNDPELATAIIRRDPVAEKRFDDRFRGWIDGIARKVGVPEADRPDVVQEALFEAIRQLRQGTFQQRSALSSWVYRIAWGKAVDHQRRQQRARLVAVDEIAVSDKALVTTPNMEQVLAVKRALDLLPTDGRVLLLASDRDQLTLKELGHILGESTSTVWDRLQRARADFRRALESGNSGTRTRLKD